MAVKGTFDVDLCPQNDKNTPAGRMVIEKKYTGAMVGLGLGQMISKRTDSGVAENLLVVWMKKMAVSLYCIRAKCPLRNNHWKFPF